MLDQGQATGTYAAERVTPRLSVAARANGMTPRMFGVLACAVATPGLSAKEVTRRLRLEKSAVCYAICRLERMGLVRHETDPADLRRMRIFATDTGMAMLRTVATAAVRPSAPPAACPPDDTPIAARGMPAPMAVSEAEAMAA